MELHWRIFVPALRVGCVVSRNSHGGWNELQGWLWRYSCVCQACAKGWRSEAPERLGLKGNFERRRFVVYRFLSIFDSTYTLYIRGPSGFDWRSGEVFAFVAQKKYIHTNGQTKMNEH